MFDRMLAAPAPAAAPSHGSGPRENNFNLLRLLLASGVIVSHSAPLLDGDSHRELGILLTGKESLGVLAVDAFFLLSGFLICGSWLSQPRPLAFLGKRVARIYPGFVVAAIFSYLVIAPLAGHNGYWASFRPGKFLVGMATLAYPLGPNPYASLPYHDANGSLWTIRYEFACYLLALALGLAGIFRRRWIALALAVGVLAWQVLIHRGILPLLPHWVVALSDGEIPRLAGFFLVGASYRLFRDRVRFTRLGVLTAAAVLAAAWTRVPTTLLALPACGGYLLLAFGLAGPIPGTGWVRRHDVSYGTYLYAWPIQQCLILVARPSSPWALAAMALPLAMFAGWLSWTLVERPVLGRFMGRPGRPRPDRIEASPPGSMALPARA